MKINNDTMRGIAARMQKEILGKFVVSKIEIWHANDQTGIRIDFPTRNMYPPGKQSAHWWIDDCVLGPLDAQAAERLYWSVIYGMLQILEYHCVRVVPQDGVLDVHPIIEKAPTKKSRRRK